jgi:hypothetical protein
VAALLRFAHHRKRGVLVNLEGLEGVGNEKDLHGIILDGYFEPLLSSSDTSLQSVVIAWSCG